MLKEKSAPFSVPGWVLDSELSLRQSNISMYTATSLNLIFLCTGFGVKLNVKVKFISMWYLWLCFLYFFSCWLLYWALSGPHWTIKWILWNWSSEGHMEINVCPGFSLSSCWVTLLTMPHAFGQGPFIFVYFWKYCTNLLDGLGSAQGHSNPHFFFL